MTSTRLIAIAAVALAAAGAAQAQSMRMPQSGRWTAELGYTPLDVRSSSLTLKPSAVRAGIGYQLHHNLDVEGLALFRANTDNATASVGGVPTNVDVRMKPSVGLFAKPKMTLGERLDVFGRLGWMDTRVSHSASLPGASASFSDGGNDFAYGLGANWRFGRTNAMYLGLDWMRYHDKDALRVDGWTASLGLRF